MDKKFLPPILFVASLLVSFCTARSAPDTPTPVPPVDTPKPSSTATIGPFTISGEFILTNTSSPGMEVGIETMNILLEYRLSVEDPWIKIEVNCFFDPPPPAVLKDELLVQYECQYENHLPADSEQRVTAEVEIFGSNEVFRLLVNPP